MKKFIIFFSVMLLFLLITPIFISLAAPPDCSTYSDEADCNSNGCNWESGTCSKKTSTIVNPLPWDTFQALVGRVIEWIINIGMLIVPLIIVIAGISFATAGGDPTKIEKAKKMLLYAIIGMAVILLSKSLVDSLKKIIVLPSNP